MKGDKMKGDKMKGDKISLDKGRGRDSMMLVLLLRGFILWTARVLYHIPKWKQVNK
jgi:hypothetical protein